MGATGPRVAGSAVSSHLAVVEVTAPAKLTLGLRVIGVRGDGYHLIDAEMVSLAWADILTITPGRQGLSAAGPFADGTPLDDTNLVARALRLAGRDAAVHLHKNIPHGGGLGGGLAGAGRGRQRSGALFSASDRQLARGQCGQCRGWGGDTHAHEFLEAAKVVKEKIGASLYMQDATLGGQSNLMYWVPLYELGGNICDESGENIVMDNEAGMEHLSRRTTRDVDYLLSFIPI